MKHVNPQQMQREQLKQLWERSFGAHNGFWDLFLQVAFAPERCRCLEEEGRILAALTWLDVEYRNQKMAYVYAVATDPAHRGQGLCRQLLENTHRHLTESGYAAALLLPGSDALRQFYGKFGYQTCTTVSEGVCAGFGTPMAVRGIGTEEYRLLRRQFLPENGVIQEGENLSFLEQQAQFYLGEGCLLAAYQDDGALNVMEYLGDVQDQPRVVKSLGCWQGRFRGPGMDKPFAMGRPLQEGAVLPGYFGFSFD